MGKLPLLGALALLALSAGAATAATRPAAPQVEIRSVSAKAQSAVVRWHVDRPARIVVESGIDGRLGVWSVPKQARGAGTGLTVLGGLEPGTRFELRVHATAGSRRSSAAAAFTTRPMPTSPRGAVTPNALLVDGQPFFPRMVWRQCPWAYERSLKAGINLFMGTSCTTEPDQLARLAGKALSVTAIERRHVQGPGLVGWHQLDEADAQVGGPDGLPLVPPSGQTGRVPFLTLTYHFFSGGDPLPQGRGMYPGLIARAEMVGFDLYPLQIWCRRGTLHAVYEAQRELVALAKGKPTYQWIEAGPMNTCYGLDPSPALVRAETWLAIAGGARGIGWFPDNWTPAVEAELRRLSDDLIALAPALLSGERPVQVSEGPVRAGAREHNGAVYVIAVNSWIDKARATFTVPGLGSRTLRVWGGSRVLKARNGRFTDFFRGLANRVYVAEP